MSRDLIARREVRDVWRRGLAVTAWLLAAMLPWRAAAQGLGEYEVKAAFVYNFIKFTEWPAEAWNRPGALRLCVAGPANEFAAALAGLADKPPVNGKAVQVARIGAPGEVQTCHLLVLTAHDRVATDWLHRAASAPVLTVGDAPGFAAAGGIVGLVVEGGKVRFEVNQDTAQGARLKLSSQVLKLARIVRSSA